MKNKLTDLNDYLFAQLDRLSDENLTAEQIASEVTRTLSVVQVADRIVDNAKLQLDAWKASRELGGDLGKQLPQLGAGASGEVKS
jgi:hypothetical protein